MATKNPIQKGTTRARKGKQCVLSAVHRTRNKMDACSIQIPSEINVAQGHSSKKLHRLVTPQRAECEKILPRNNGNTKGAYEPNSQECEIDKVILNKRCHNTQREEVQRRRHSCLQRQRDNILGPDRKIPKMITKRVQIHYGDGRNRQHRNFSGTDEKQKGQRNDSSIRRVTGKTTTGRQHAT